MDKQPELSPNVIDLTWDLGTAYDFFVSLLVLHTPSQFGLRRSWAAGVRSRLPADERQTLDEGLSFLPVPINWIYSFEGTKDTRSILAALAALLPARRLEVLMFNSHSSPVLREVIQEVSLSGNSTGQQVDALSALPSFRRRAHPTESAITALRWWSQPQEYGERLLKALEAYAENFFYEEEDRIRPELEKALEQACEKALQLPVERLLEELSRGVKFPLAPGLKGLVLSPSYWSTPLIVFDWVAEDRQLVLFGARPEDAHLIPGESIPEGLLRALKATADPTRLNILRYLAQEALTPSQLARLLRLRPPTVIHHLNELRLAGLVQITLMDEGERKYAIRKEVLYQSFDALQKFLEITRED